jgi:transposase-like protein
MGKAHRTTHEPTTYHRHRFPAEIISHAIWLCRVFNLSLRHVELILAEIDTALWSGWRHQTDVPSWRLQPV